MTSPRLPIAIIGAGPVGLAAACHVLARGGTPIVLEQGPAIASAVRDWGHVRIFSPWSYNIDDEARRLLEASGWRAPQAGRGPTRGRPGPPSFGPPGAPHRRRPPLPLGPRAVVVSPPRSAPAAR